MRAPPELVGLYLSRHCDDPAMAGIEPEGASAILELLYGLARGVKAAADMVNWTPEAVAEVDRALEWMADNAGDGDTIDFPLSAAGRAELWQRWSWAIIAVAAEEHQDTGFELPLPAAASNGAKVMAVLLFLLSGIGREYPQGWFGKH